MANGVYEPEFGRLLDAILEQPQSVKEIVRRNPESIEATNRAGENALRWCALENRFDDVINLRNLGSSIQSEALFEAIEHGNTDMLLLLLELGGTITPSDAASSLRIGKEFGDLSKRHAHIIISHLKAHGCDVAASGENF